MYRSLMGRIYSSSFLKDSKRSEEMVEYTQKVKVIIRDWTVGKWRKV
jgi:hypothetical protein